MLLPLAASTAAVRLVKEGQITISQCAAVAVSRPELFEEGGGFRGRLVHFPIARHDWFSHKICGKKLVP
jgi:hypothetical protein